MWSPGRAPRLSCCATLHIELLLRRFAVEVVRIDGDSPIYQTRRVVVIRATGFLDGAGNAGHGTSPPR
jgi:hypothetical protein